MISATKNRNPAWIIAAFLATVTPAAATASPSRTVDVKVFGKRVLKAVSHLDQASDINKPAFLKHFKVPFRSTTDGDIYLSSDAVDQWTLVVQRFVSDKPLKPGLQVALYAKSILSDYMAPCLFSIDTVEKSLGSHGYEVIHEFDPPTESRGWTFRKNDIVIRIDESDIKDDCVRLIFTID